MSLTESERVLKAIGIFMDYFMRLCVFACGREGGVDSLRQEY